MAPRNKPQPWWHANSSWLVALALALAGGWLNDKVRAAGNDRLLDTMPERRDREVDAMQGDIRELRAAVVELMARCQTGNSRG